MSSIWLALHQHWRCLWELKELRMSKPSKSQSSTMGGEDYFIWREKDGETTMQKLSTNADSAPPKKTTQRGEWGVMGSNVGNRPFSKLAHSKLTHDFEANCWSFLPWGIEFSYGSYSRQSREESLSDRQTQSDEKTTSTWVSRKMRYGKRSHLLDALRAKLGRTSSAKCGEAITHVRNSMPEKTLPTTKVASWSAADTSSTRFLQSATGWHALHAIQPPYHQLRAAQGIHSVKVHNVRWHGRTVWPYYAL